jgi:hypothetical protein
MEIEAATWGSNLAPVKALPAGLDPQAFATTHPRTAVPVDAPVRLGEPSNERHEFIRIDWPVAAEPSSRVGRVLRGNTELKDVPDVL